MQKKDIWRNGRVIYLVTICRVGVTVLVEAIGEIEKVNQVFHLAGRFSEKLHH